MNLGPIEIGLILLTILLLFGYKKLPDASRSLGRSMRIFKGEMKGMRDDDRSKDAAEPPVPPQEIARSTALAPTLVAARPPAPRDGNGLVPPASVDDVR